jgi:phenylpropionate dioxygenase-like ring-hydroxylating dioxygenase large terminal subunit
VQGNIWVYLGTDPDGAPEIPIVPGVGDVAYQMVETMPFPGSVDHAVVGLMDPAHGPFVHRSWWWRSRRSIHEKAKEFAASDWGFTMLRHAPSSNSRAYRILGGAPETEIIFRLPGVRIEHIRAGRHILCNLTAVTPIDEATTEVNHAIYWTMPWLTPLKPLLRPFARNFLRQDRDIVALQQQGLRHAPPLLLINDADTQAKWYYRLKAEYQRARAEGRAFVNPVKGRTLRWRS